MRKTAALLILSGSLHAADATTNGTPAEAFQSGKDFAASMQETVEATLNEQSAREHIDYTDAPPQASTYQDIPPRSMGDDKKNYCANVDLSTLNERDRKECEGVNYLAGMENRTNPYVLDEGTDPLFKRYEEGKLLAERINADTCSLEGSTIPSDSGRTEICTEAVQRSDQTCQDTLDVKVTRTGRTYQLEFAVSILLAKSSSNRCEEDWGGGTFRFDLGKFTSFFSGSELTNNYYWKPNYWVGLHAGSRVAYGQNFVNQRINQSITTISSRLSDNGDTCHSSPNMLSVIHVRPIYTNDMIDFLYKEGDVLKPANTSSFKDVSIFRVVSVNVPSGVSSSGPTCNLGEDMPKYVYTMGGSTYSNGPRRCNPNPSRSAKVIDQQAGILDITVGKGSPPFSYHYIHNFSETYMGLGYPIRLKLAVDKSVTTVRDEWIYGCSQFRN